MMTREVGWGDGREAQERDDVCKIMTDLVVVWQKTNTTLERNFPPIKKKLNTAFKKKKKRHNQ